MTAQISHETVREMGLCVGSLNGMIGKVVRLGALRLRVIDYDWNTFSLEVALDGFWVAFLAAIRPKLRLADLIYRRLIITAAVWRLAEYKDYALPSYRDLYAVQWITRKANRLKARFSEVEKH